MSELIAVGCGGFVGAVLRWWLSVFVARVTTEGFPWGTFVVNILGCLVMGVLAGLVETRNVLGPHMRHALVVGFVGSFTTFSTFGRETLILMERGATLMATIYVLASLVFGLAAVWLGMRLC